VLRGAFRQIVVKKRTEMSDRYIFLMLFPFFNLQEGNRKESKGGKIFVD
jgi:hypothetical protein